MLKTRLLSAIVIAALGVAMLYIPKGYQLLILCGLSGVMVQEVSSFCPERFPSVTPWVFFLLGCFASYFYFLPMWGLVLLSLCIRTILMLKNQQFFELFWFSSIFDISLFSICAYHMLGEQTIVFLVSITIVAGVDVFGYAFGKMLGRHHAIFWVSPNKTYEGYLGALLWMLLLGIILMIWQDYSISLLTLHLLMVYILAVVGDLNMSFLKRHIGIKDTGAVIPGHGGVLDRADGWLTVLPWVYVFYVVLK